MAAAWIVEAVDVFKDGHLSLPACCPRMPPNQLGLDGFEERLNSGVIVAIAFAAHRRLKPVLAQDLLIIMRAILAATIRVMPSRQIAMQSPAGQWMQSRQPTDLMLQALLMAVWRRKPTRKVLVHCKRRLDSTSILA